MKIEIEKPFNILRMVNMIDLVAGEYYSHWLYWNDSYLLFPIESTRLIQMGNLHRRNYKYQN